MKQKYGIVTQWRAFPLHPDTPKEGMTLEALFKGRMVDISAMMARLRKAAETEGLPFGNRHMTYNSRLAQELGKWAEALDRMKDFNDAVFQAYFAHGRNIGEISELVRIAASVGLSPEEAERVLKERRFRTAVDRDWERSEKMGVTAVPTFFMKGRVLVGAQSDGALDEFVRSGKLRLL